MSILHILIILSNSLSINCGIRWTCCHIWKTMIKETEIISCKTNNNHDVSLYYVN